MTDHQIEYRVIFCSPTGALLKEHIIDDPTQFGITSASWSPMGDLFATISSDRKVVTLITYLIQVLELLAETL